LTSIDGRNAKIKSSDGWWWMPINADALSFFQMQALKQWVLVGWDFKWVELLPL
jgi:hypothetical protein